jgi:two-component system, cell cycle sensor histidine kinase and response regulator CckA
MAPALTTARMNRRPDTPDHQARVLIVDDDAQSRQLLEAMLAPEGFLIETASGGEEALAIVARQPPDLILLDIMMSGMDGYQVAASIKGDPATKSIPVIMVTALDDRNAMLLGLRAGAEDFLAKPVDRAEMRVRVRNLLRLKAYSDYHDNYSQMLEKEVGSRTADLVESLRLYRSTFEAAPVGIVHVGLDGRWLRVNQRLCDLLGYSREELQSAGIQERVQGEEVDGEAAWSRQMAEGPLDRHVADERQYRRKDGTFVHVRVNTSVHRDAEDQSRFFISVIEDVTEQRLLEAQVQQAGKMDAIGLLASGVAHDFNNLLTVILGFAAIVNEDVAIAEKHGRDLGEIIKAAERAAGLTKQLLAFSRQQVLRTAPLDANGLITDMTGMLRMLIGENITITLSLAPDLPLALADRGQIEQVVMNLVVNARDAMPDGGRVTIETADVELSASSIHKQEVIPGHYVMLAITDTGKGMTKETQRRLFEPFFTTKETGKGTGLGLSTVYGIVRQSGGAIEVYSEPGRGTTFKVYLPRFAGAAAAPRPVSGVRKALPTWSETVLVVEDEAAIRQLTNLILQKAGYTVLLAESPVAAERIAGNHPGPIHLMLTDVVMPGMRGPELAERMLRLRPDLRVLFMSGYTDDAITHHGFLDAGTEFLQKPFTPLGLMQKIREVLDAPPA